MRSPLPLTVILALGACASAPDIGRAVAVATATDGATVTLHDSRGPCLGEAHFAVWASPDRARTVPGCWLVADGSILVSFLDGERGNIPISHLMKVDAS